MSNKSRVLLLFILLNGVYAADSIQRPSYRNSNHTRSAIPGIYPYINTSPSTIQAAESLFHTSPFWAIVICILVILMIVCTLIGNAMVCLAVFSVRRLKSQPANLLLVSLAVADFCVGLFVMPIALIKIIDDDWLSANAVCTLWTTSDLMLCTASIMNLCLISVDRYLAVTQPLTYIANRTRKRIFIYILIVWVCALLVCITPLIVFPIQQQTEGSCEVSQNQLYQIYATLLSFYIPCLIMILLYWRMWKAAKSLQKRDNLATKWSITQTSEDNDSKLLGGNLNVSKNGLSNGNSFSINNLFENLPKSRINLHRPSSILHAIRFPLINSKGHEKSEDKARKTLGVIMTVFIVCWLPFFIFALLKSLDIIAVPYSLDLLVLWLGYSNSMLNPILYCKYNREFRIPFREMLCCRFSTLQTVMRNDSFLTKFGSPRMTELRNSSITAAAVLALPNITSESSVKFGMDGQDSKENGNHKVATV